MNIQDLGAWGELLGGIGGVIAALGVIVTLLYLARQVRENARYVQSTAYAAVMTGNVGVHETHMEAVDVLPDYFSGRADAWNFDSVDYLKFHGHATQVFMNFELAFLLHKNRTVDREYFDAKMGLAARSLQIPGMRRWWTEWAFYFYDRRFVSHVNELIGGLEPEAEPMGA